MTGPASANGPAADAGVGRRFCLVASRFNQEVTDRLVEGARSCLERHGAAPVDIEVIRVPGAFELPLATRWVLDRGGVDGVAALGCVIRGETPHFEFISLGVTVGIEALARERGIPVTFGVLTTDDGAQARARAGSGKGSGKGNKGEEAALALLEMCELADALKGGG